MAVSVFQRNTKRTVKGCGDPVSMQISALTDREKKKKQRPQPYKEQGYQDQETKKGKRRAEALSRDALLVGLNF